MGEDESCSKTEADRPAELHPPPPPTPSLLAGPPGHSLRQVRPEQLQQDRILVSPVPCREAVIRAPFELWSENRAPTLPKDILLNEEPSLVRENKCLSYDKSF